MMHYEPSEWKDRRQQKRKMRLYWRGYYHYHKGEEDRTKTLIFAVYALVMAICLVVYALVFAN